MTGKTNMCAVRKLQKEVEVIEHDKKFDRGVCFVGIDEGHQKDVFKYTLAQS
jgi:hypothetical protein